jgi:uncharacterized protein (TIGR03083 family)
VEVLAHVDELERQGIALAEAAERAGPDVPVPSCPGWAVRDLVAHTAGVHEWAATFVRADPGAQQDVELAPTAPGEDVVARYRAAHAELVRALRAAPPDLDTWAFLRAPSPLAFWARRQAHEAAVHRADAESATGTSVTYEPTFAADGIDELLRGFFARRGRRLRSERPLRLLVAPDDVTQRWLATIDQDGCRTEVPSADAPADCAVRGSVSALYLLLWNRAEDVHAEGDREVLALWREHARVTWS